MKFRQVRTKPSNLKHAKGRVQLKPMVKNEAKDPIFESLAFYLPCVSHAKTGTKHLFWF